MATETVIPKRQVFKAAEVCSIAGVPPYILKSWEAEFPMLARPRRKGGSRVYRRTDVEMVLQIKQLVFGEGLTLGAAHRKIEATVGAAEEPSKPGLPANVLETDVRDRIAGVRQGLQDLLQFLSANGEPAASPTKTASRGAAVVKAQSRSTKRSVNRPMKSMKSTKKNTAKTRKGAARKRSA